VCDFVKFFLLNGIYTILPKGYLDCLGIWGYHSTTTRAVSFISAQESKLICLFMYYFLPQPEIISIFGGFIRELKMNLQHMLYFKIAGHIVCEIDQICGGQKGN
jgi:hypothetical protein